MKVAQSLLPPGSTGSAAYQGTGPGSPVLRGDRGTAVRMSLTLDLISGGSFAHGHKTPSQYHLFLMEVIFWSLSSLVLCLTLNSFRT